MGGGGGGGSLVGGCERRIEVIVKMQKISPGGGGPAFWGVGRGLAKMGWGRGPFGWSWWMGVNQENRLL